MEADKVKDLTRALRAVVALDRREARGEMDDRARAALKDAEATIGAASGRRVLEAFRSWQASGVFAVDPTGGPVRAVSKEYEDMALRARGR